MAQVPDADEDIILCACSSVDNLWLTSHSETSSLLSRIIPLPLKHLHCFLGRIIGVHIDFTHSLFAQIMHLQIFDTVLPTSQAALWSGPAGLAAIPHLSHLAFDEWYLILWITVLRTCMYLHVLIALAGPPRLSTRPGSLHLSACQRFNLDDTHPHVRELAEDPRFVLMSCPDFLEDWQMGAQGGTDYWTRAEDFVAKRRLGAIPCLQYELQDDETDAI
ncbi:hypothetical protein C8R43DRAFT_1116602 [Mycena crocata]|nr:hypothetical protein C8R43DRAFT_1116602 [Mycena crocata]